MKSVDSIPTPIPSTKDSPAASTPTPSVLVPAVTALLSNSEIHTDNKPKIVVPAVGSEKPETKGEMDGKPTAPVDEETKQIERTNGAPTGPVVATNGKHENKDGQDAKGNAAVEANVETTVVAAVANGDKVDTASKTNDEKPDAALVTAGKGDTANKPSGRKADAVAETAGEKGDTDSKATATEVGKPPEAGIRFGNVEIVAPVSKPVDRDDDDDEDDADYNVEEDVDEQEGEEDMEVCEETPEKNAMREAMPKLSKGLVANLLTKGALGQRELHDAADEGQTELVKELLGGGWKDRVDELDLYNYTPLHVAAEKGHVDVVKALIEGGADLAKVTKIYSSTPLHYAAFEGHVEVAKVLLEAGADIDVVTEDLRTPLYQAAFKGHLSCVVALMKHGADADMKTAEGKKAADATTNEEIIAALASDGQVAKKRKLDSDQGQKKSN